MRAETHSGITIDICPKCQGVWLDAGEFDAVRVALLPPGRTPPRQSRQQDAVAWIEGIDLIEAVVSLVADLLDG